MVFLCKQWDVLICVWCVLIYVQWKHSITLTTVLCFMSFYDVSDEMCVYDATNLIDIVLFIHFLSSSQWRQIIHPCVYFFTIVCAVTENDRHMWWIGKWNFCSFLEQRCVIVIVTVSCFSECLNTYRLHLLLTICFLLIFCWLVTDLFFCRWNTTKGNGITAGIYTNVYKITITTGSKKLPILIFPHGWG